MHYPADRTGAWPSGASTTIRRSLFLHFMVLASLCIVLLTLGYHLFGLKPMIERVSRLDFKNAAENIDHRLDHLFSTVEDQLSIARELVLESGLDIDRPDEFNRMFRPLVQHYPQITSVVAGDSDGHGWMLLQLGGGSWHNRFTDIPRRGNLQRFIDWDTRGARKERFENIDYDPRERPWFIKAMSVPSDGVTHWTAPYTFFTTDDPGITGSRRVNLPNGRSVVIGIDIKLLDISKATMPLIVGRNGRTLVVTDDGRVIGLPHTGTRSSDDVIRNQMLKPVEALHIASASDAVNAWRNIGRKTATGVIFRSGNQEYIAAFRPFALGNQFLWVMVYAPTADFIPPLGKLLGTLMGFVLLVLLLSLYMAARYTRRISTPLESLAASSERISRLDFGGKATATIDTPLAEVRQLADAQERMRVMLANYRSTVDKQSDDLQQQILMLRQTEARLEHLSQHDPLTDLPNRTLFTDRLRQAIIRSNRSKRMFALMFIDLDDFKIINDTCGHEAGDRLLVEVARRLRSCLREEDSVSRLGGDEFVAMVEDLSPSLPDASAQSSLLAEKLSAALAEPYMLDGKPHRVTASIGVALNSNPDEGGDAILHNADIAMYRAKSSGNHEVRFFDPSMLKPADEMQPQK